MQEKLNKPQNEELKYPHLSHDLIEGVKKSVIGEVERSKPYGLVIEDSLINRETDYFLQRVDSLSGEKPLAFYRWEEFRDAIGVTMYNDFKDKIDSFHKKFKKNGQDLRMFDYHLEYARMAIVTLVENTIGLI